MSLNHQFGIVRADPSRYLSRKDWNGLSFEMMLGLIESPLSVHDDILRYMADSLTWISSYNPFKQRKQRGLNFHGITLILGSGAGTAAEVFKAWAKLFALGPKKLTLTGAYATIVGVTAPGKYTAIHSSRDFVVRTLDALANQCGEVAYTARKSFLLHLGV